MLLCSIFHLSSINKQHRKGSIRYCLHLHHIADNCFPKLKVNSPYHQHSHSSDLEILSLKFWLQSNRRQTHHLRWMRPLLNSSQLQANQQVGSSHNTCIHMWTPCSCCTHMPCTSHFLGPSKYCTKKGTCTCAKCGKKWESETDEVEYWVECSKCKRWHHQHCTSLQELPDSQENWEWTTLQTCAALTQTEDLIYCHFHFVNFTTL